MFDITKLDVKNRQKKAKSKLLLEQPTTKAVENPRTKKNKGKKKVTYL